MASRYRRVLITSPTAASVDGVPVEYVEPNIYASVFRHLGAIAQQEGTTVLVCGVDHTQQGQVAWFTVDQSGHAEAAKVSEIPQPDATVEFPAETSQWSPPATSITQTPPPTTAAQQPVLPAEPPQAWSVTTPQRLAPASIGTAAGMAAPQPRRIATPNTAPHPQPALQSPPLFVRPPKAVPQTGFRGAVYRLTAGRINLGPSQTEVRAHAQHTAMSRDLQRPYSTAFLSFKGGIGKTSTTVGVGLTLARLRGAPPVAIDANPDSGDLAERLMGEQELLRMNPHTITHLVHDVESIQTWTDLSRYLMQIERLHVVAGEQEPAVSDSLTAEGYAKVHSLLRNFFSIILTDCGTGVTHNAMKGILDRSDSVVIAAGYAVSGAKRAVSTLSWLAEHGYGQLAQSAVVVLTDKDGVSSRVEKNTIRDHLAAHSRHVFVVPNDPAVADGDRISLERVNPRTREAWSEVAAALVDGYR